MAATTRDPKGRPTACRALSIAASISAEPDMGVMFGTGQMGSRAVITRHIEKLWRDFEAQHQRKRPPHDRAA
jgi:hypothetical protein